MNAKTKAINKAKKKSHKVYIAPEAPSTAFHARNKSEQDKHEKYYKENKGHYEYR